MRSDRSTTAAMALTLAVSLAACSDDGPAPPDRAPTTADAGTSPATMAQTRGADTIIDMATTSSIRNSTKTCACVSAIRARCTPSPAQDVADRSSARAKRRRQAA